jgi:hypothetical protein
MTCQVQQQEDFTNGAYALSADIVLKKARYNIAPRFHYSVSKTNPRDAPQLSYKRIRTLQNELHTQVLTVSSLPQSIIAAKLPTNNSGAML